MDKKKRILFALVLILCLLVIMICFRFLFGGQSKAGETESENIEKVWITSGSEKQTEETGTESVSVFKEEETSEESTDKEDQETEVTTEDTNLGDGILPIEFMTRDGFQIDGLPEEVVQVFQGFSDMGAVRENIFEGICNLGYGDFDRATYINHEVNPFNQPGSEDIMYLSLEINDPMGIYDVARYVNVIIDTNKNEIYAVTINSNKGKFLIATR